MDRIKVAFVCHFSNKDVRKNLPLKTWKCRNCLLELFHHATWKYDDYAMWVEDFINMFKEHAEEIELHIVAPHKGLKRKGAEFIEGNVNYHFYKMDSNLVGDILYAKTNWGERSDYRKERNRCCHIIESINPDIVCLCGAENPEYSTVVFEIKDKPVYLIPQTFLNDPKRIAMGVASQYRIDLEKKVFEIVGYVSSKGEKTQAFARKCNPDVKFFPMAFPTHQPSVSENVVREYDFVFYANNVMKNKGIEDVLHSLAIVKKEYPAVSLNVIGGCEALYKRHLDEIVKVEGIADNVVFSGQYENIDDVFYNVQKAKAVVVPGITATLNSTVRESMLMGLPVIVYYSEVVAAINKDKQCILIANMEDISDLADKMILAMSNDQEMANMAYNGKEYAETIFSNKSIGITLVQNIKSIINDNQNLTYKRRR